MKQHTKVTGKILKGARGKSGEGNGTPLQYSCLENPMDGGAWWAAVHGVAKSRTRLSDFTFTFHCHALEKEMATHSSVLAWRVPGTGEPGGLPPVGSHRVGHHWVTQRQRQQRGEKPLWPPRDSSNYCLQVTKFKVQRTLLPAKPPFKHKRNKVIFKQILTEGLS